MHPELARREGEPVEHEQSPDERLADAEDQLDRFERLHASR